MKHLRLAMTLWLSIVLPSTAMAVDGVIEINQARVEAGGITAGDGVGFPATLDESGSYVLTSDLLAPNALDGIKIEADDVTLDLNGFSIQYVGPTTFRDGILVSVQTNVEIRNGTIRGFSRHGIFTVLSSDVRVIGVRAIENGINGMNLEAMVSGEGGHVVRDCHVAGNGSEGVRLLGLGGMITGTVARHNGGVGLLMAGSGSGYGGNVLVLNNSGGAQVSGGVAIACNNLNGTVVCPP